MDSRATGWHLNPDGIPDQRPALADTRWRTLGDRAAPDHPTRSASGASGVLGALPTQPSAKADAKGQSVARSDTIRRMTAF
jgi:hypothetical protein